MAKAGGMRGVERATCPLPMIRRMHATVNKIQLVLAVFAAALLAISLILLSNTLYRSVKTGDIVVVSKQSFENGTPIVKRVIATEGQTVDIDFDAGTVSVDGVVLDEPYTNTPTNRQEGMTFPLTVSEGCIFVMGDNRNDSKDSRSTEIGLVDTREVLGKAVFLFLPGNNQGQEKANFKRIGVLS